MLIKIGVIGCGNMGRNHIRVLRSLGNLYELVGVYDTNKENAEKAANIYGIQPFDNAEDLINKVDAISIVVPSCLHQMYSDLCVGKGKHVLVEKPLALNINDAKKMKENADKANVILMVGHIERYNPVTEELNKILENEEIISLDFHRLSPYDKRISDTDVVRDLMIHDIDILNGLVTEKPINIKSTAAAVYSDKYDYAQALIEYPNGIRASLTASRVTEAKNRRLEVHAKGAYISVDYIDRSINIARRTNFKLNLGYEAAYKQENIIERVFVPLKEPLVVELEHFAESIINNKKPKTAGEDGVKALQICDWICEEAIR